MTISREEVLKLASLARLEVDEASVERLTGDLGKFLDYVKLLDELDTSNVPPTAQVTVDHAPLRADEVRKGLSKEAALAQAPRADQVGFLVPGFVDES